MNEHIEGHDIADNICKCIFLGLNRNMFVFETLQKFIPKCPIVSKLALVKVAARQQARTYIVWGNYL